MRQPTHSGSSTASMSATTASPMRSCSVSRRACASTSEASVPSPTSSLARVHRDGRRAARRQEMMRAHRRDRNVAHDDEAAGRRARSGDDARREERARVDGVAGAELVDIGVGDAGAGAHEIGLAAQDRGRWRAGRRRSRSRRRFGRSAWGPQLTSVTRTSPTLGRAAPQPGAARVNSLTPRSCEHRRTGHALTIVLRSVRGKVPRSPS